MGQVMAPIMSVTLKALIDCMYASGATLSNKKSYGLKRI